MDEPKSGARSKIPKKRIERIKIQAVTSCSTHKTDQQETDG